MIGVIVCGHGHFASGLSSSISFIAGEQSNFIAIDFEEDVRKLEKDLNCAYEKFKDLKGVIVFCDLAGGSPFKTAVLLSQNYTGIEIIAGVNLAMLAEITLARTFIEDLDRLVESAIQTGKEQILRFSKKEVLIIKEYEISDGI